MRKRLACAFLRNERRGTCVQRFRTYTKGYLVRACGVRGTHSIMHDQCETAHDRCCASSFTAFTFHFVWPFCPFLSSFVIVLFLIIFCFIHMFWFFSI